MQKKVLIAVSAIIFSCISMYGQAAVVTVPGSTSFDIESWLVAIDEVGQSIDQVRATYQTITNQITQIEKAAERAKKINWNDFSTDFLYDDNYDIRYDIRNAGKKVNSYLTKVRNLRDTLTTDTIVIGNTRYSVADICGFGDQDRNFATAVEDYHKYFSDHYQNAVDALEGKLTESQKIAIMNKYGVSPANYIMVTEAANIVKNKTAKVLGRATEQAKEIEMTERQENVSLIITAALQTVDSDGNPTESALAEANIQLGALTVEELGKVGEQLNDGFAMVGQNLIKMEHEKQAEIEAQQAAREAREIKDSQVPLRFIKSSGN